MPGRKLDRVGTRSALETVRESPVITTIVVSPVVVVFVLVWLIGGFGWALFSLIALGALGVAALKYL